MLQFERRGKVAELLLQKGMGGTITTDHQVKQDVI